MVEQSFVYDSWVCRSLFVGAILRSVVFRFHSWSFFLNQGRSDFFPEFVSRLSLQLNTLSDNSAVSGWKSRNGFSLRGAYIHNTGSQLLR